MHYVDNFRRKTSLVLLILVAGTTFLFAKDPTLEETKAAIDSRLAAIRAAGEPVTLEELNKWYEEPAVGKNAADLYLQAFAALTPGEPTNAAYVAQNQKAIALLLQAAERPACRYPLDLTKGFSLALPHLAQIKRSANLLATAAAQEVTRAHTDEAAKLLNAGSRLSQSLVQEPTLISRLVALASMTITFQALEKALSARPFTEAQLLQIQQSLNHADELASFHRVFVAERAFCFSMFQTAPAELSKINPDLGTNLTQLEAYWKTPAFQNDKLFMLDTFSNLIAQADLQPPGLPGAPVQIPSDYILSRMLLPATGQSLSRAVEISARLNIARTVLAIERYRVAHANALPATLAELSPVLLKGVAIDPYDQKPLRYKKLARGYVVYSVGKNKVDDGGVNPPGTKLGTAPDITFTVNR